MTNKIAPEQLLIQGINDIKDKCMFRAVMIEIIKATAYNISRDDIKQEFRVVYNTMVG